MKHKVQKKLENKKFVNIYLITNLITKEVYVGQTSRTKEERFADHCKPCHKYNLALAIQKYGKDNFKVEYLEENVPIEYGDDIEAYYVDKYDSIKNGYNVRMGGDKRDVYKNEDINNIIYLYENKRMSSEEIARLYNCKGGTILRILDDNNIVKRHDGCKITELDQDKFTKMWTSDEFDIDDIAKEFKINERTARRNASRIGLEKKNYYKTHKGEK